MADDPERGSPWDRYYNPPIFSVILGPLVLLNIRLAFGIALILNGLGLILLLRALWQVLRDRPLIYLGFAAVLITSQPVNYAFWHGQPVLFLATALTLCYGALERGAWSRAGVFWASLVLKPHWLLVPALTVKTLNRRVVVTTLLALTVAATPFITVGINGTRDFVRLVLGRGADDFASESFSAAVLSWSGFSRGLPTRPNIWAVAVMIAVTVLLFLMIWRRGDRSLLPLAGALAFLLVVPHSHPQDWVMVAPGAAYVLASLPSLRALFITVALLLVIYFGLDNWSGLRDRSHTIYWPTLGAFFLLVWTCAVSEVRAAAAKRIRGLPAR